MIRLVKFLLIAAAAILALTPLPRAVIERVYSRGLYAALQPKVTALTNRSAVSWLDVLVVVCSVAIVWTWIVRLRRREAGMLRTLVGLMIDTACAAAIIYLWFLTAWGLNYQREPLSAQLDFREDRITRAGLRELAVRNVDALNSLYTTAHEQGWPELRDVPGRLGSAFVRAQDDLELGWRVQPGVPKRSILNLYFTTVSVDGMTDPFFLETLANQSLLPFERESTVAHEWAHLAGYADESEANFLGWLICMRGPAAAQYSGWLALYGTVMRSLPRAEREEIAATLAAGPREHLRAIAHRIESQTSPTASRAGYAVYDRFLKANRVEAGVHSYGLVVRLLLGTKFNENGAPVMRR
jgi:hypothetical protein